MIKSVNFTGKNHSPQAISAPKQQKPSFKGESEINDVEKYILFNIGDGSDIAAKLTSDEKADLKKSIPLGLHLAEAKADIKNEDVFERGIHMGIKAFNEEKNKYAAVNILKRLKETVNSLFVGENPLESQYGPREVAVD